jgi:hypothetical protein
MVLMHAMFCQQQQERNLAVFFLPKKPKMFLKKRRAQRTVPVGIVGLV